jgi:hypothetical protein
MGTPNGIVRSQKGADMGTPDSKLLYTTGVAELAKEMAYGHLGGEALRRLGLDRMLLELKFRDHILPVLPDLGGFEPLETLHQTGVETIHIWKDAMYKTPLRDMRCVRLTSHGIQMHRKGESVFTILVFLTRKREWITAISENHSGSDWQWPRDFQYHNRLEDLYLWSEKLIRDDDLDRFDPNTDESFVIKLAQALDDLRRKSIHRRRETLQKLENADLDALMQNMRFTGYQYLSGVRDESMQLGIMQ